MPRRVQPSPHTPRQKRGFSFVELVVVIIIIGLLACIFLQFFPRAAHEAARRMACSNNLKQLALAMHNYHEVYECLPPAYTVDADGNRLHSWRTLLLPYLEQNALYERIDLSKPWNDPANLQATADTVPGVFVCPSSDERTKTLYMVVVDPTSCFPGAESVAFRNITDGTSNTLLIIEAPDGNGVEWMSPNDADWTLLSSINEKLKFPHTRVFQGAIADCSVRAISKTVTNDLRRSLLSIAAGD